MQRAILLQTDVTRRKAETLRRFSGEAVALANYLLQHRKSKRLMDLHRAMYSTCKANTQFNSQVICDVERSVIRSKCEALKAITVKFNAPRNCETFHTKSKFFIELGLYPRRRVAIPIRTNRNLQRYANLVKSGWACKTYGLTFSGQIVAYLSKNEEHVVPGSRSVVGVDLNSKCFAVTVLTPDGRVLRQLYYGKDIWAKRKRLMGRRARLRSLADLGNHRARRSLKRLKKRERNFVRNRVGEISKAITDLAAKFKAEMAVESLRRFSPKSRAYNREVLRIPFSLFKRRLEARCFDKGIKLVVVDAYNTSKWCSHCGAVAKSGHSSANYALFSCSKCGQTVNSDRKASFAIALKSLLVRNTSQLTSRPVPVNGLMRSDERADFGAVRHKPTPMESHLFQ